MKANFSNKMVFNKHPVDLHSSAFKADMQRADAFIFAAGFEDRALCVPLAAPLARKSIALVYKGGPGENDDSYNKIKTKYEKTDDYEVCELDLAHTERFEHIFEKSLRSIKHLESGELVMDISGMPNFAICIAIAKTRQIFPAAKLRLFYTEAEEYFPTKKDYDKLKKSQIRRPIDLLPDYLSTKAVTMFMPSLFSGVTLGQNDTCLLVFAGYEPHRTNCAIEALNPNKLVLIYGEPGRPDLSWRYDLSRLMHRGIDDQLKRTEEKASTADVGDNLALLLKYYEYLYDDHTIAVCPINSKIQAVAATLAWETYPDIQLNFPIPAQYLPKRFSLDSRETFSIDLGCSPAARRFMPLDESP
jgi:hypothetical protein